MSKVSLALLPIFAQNFINGYCRLCFRLRASFIVLVFTVSLCFGLHGHLQVCKIFIFICLKDSASLLFVAFWVCCLFFTWSHTARFPFVFFLSCFLRYFVVSLCMCSEPKNQRSRILLVDPIPDLILLRESGSARNRSRTSGSVARNSDH
jgi:hypothetical protein